MLERTHPNVPSARVPKEAERHRLALWPPRVLLVVCEPDVRRAIAERLRESGCDVIESDCCTQLLDHLASCELLGRYYPPPDVLVCDARLPGFLDPEIVLGLSDLRAVSPVVLTGLDGTPAFDDVARRIGPSATFGDPLDVLEVRDRVLDLMPDDAWLRSSWFW